MTVMKIKETNINEIFNSPEGVNVGLIIDIEVIGFT
jgi:hypothetical protein